MKIYNPTQEAEAGGFYVYGMPGPQDEFKTTLDNLVKLYLTKE